VGPLLDRIRRFRAHLYELGSRRDEVFIAKIGMQWYKCEFKTVSDDQDFEWYVCEVLTKETNAVD